MVSVGQIASKLRHSETATSSHQRYGTFFGVYLPSVLSVFGVIMYLRIGVVLGHVGLFSTLSIICLSSLITFLTGLSIAAIATNMRVDKGGAYYIVSRSLGIDFGSAIGIPLYIAQAIGLAFYMLGFSEMVTTFFPFLNPKIISLSTLAAIGILGYFSTNWVLKTQLFILVVLAASLVSLFLGHSYPDPEAWNQTSLFSGKIGYWAAFAIFFPAVTGIEAGLSMSGVLKNSTRSLPIGTLASVITGLLIYLALAFFLWYNVPPAILTENATVCKEIARWSFLIVAGISGATLSSALAATLSAPRTLQALADDGIVFHFLRKESGKAKEPRIAAFVTLILASCFILIGNIDLIAPVLTMFFLISYGTLNLVAGLETVMGNPSWRPAFGVPASVSLGGACLCLMAMLMISAGATMVALAVVLMIYFLRGRKLSSNWDDICFGILMFFTKSTLYRLKSSEFAARNWRPHLLVFSPSAIPPPSLMDFTVHLTQGNSFVTLAHMIEPTSPYNIPAVQKAFGHSLKKHKLQAFVDVSEEKAPLEGYKRFISTHGIGPITHNTVVLMHLDSNGQEYELFPKVLLNSYQAGKNTVVLKSHGDSTQGVHTIDIWWDSSERKTSELLLVFAYMYQATLGKKKATITLKSIVSSETARESRLNYFVKLFSQSRLRVNYHVYVAQEAETLKTISFFSQDSDLTFIGLPSPGEGVDNASFPSVYAQYVKSMRNLKKVAFILAAEPVEFQKIFR